MSKPFIGNPKVAPTWAPVCLGTLTLWVQDFSSVGLMVHLRWEVLHCTAISRIFTPSRLVPEELSKHSRGVGLGSGQRPCLEEGWRQKLS